MLKLENSVFDGIIDLLLLDAESERGRKSLLIPYLRNYQDLQNQVNWSGSPKEFSVALVDLLWKHGEVEEGKQALILLLNALEPLAGEGDQKRIAQLIETINQAEELPPGTDHWPEDQPTTRGGLGTTTTTTIDTGGGAFIGGSVSVGGSFNGRDSITHNKIVQGDEVQGDKVGGDKISVGNISGSSGVAIGRGAQATVTTGIASEDFSEIFAPLLKAIRSTPGDKQAEALQKAQVLQQEATKGEQADDEKTADLIDELVDLVPYASSAIKACFDALPLGGWIGPITKRSLKWLERL